MTLGYTRSFFTLPLLSRSLYHISASPTWKHIAGMIIMLCMIDLWECSASPALPLILLQEEERPERRITSLERVHASSSLKEAQAFTSIAIAVAHAESLSFQTTCCSDSSEKKRDVCRCAPYSRGPLAPEKRIDIRKGLIQGRAWSPCVFAGSGAG
jgi:hypothetical protein